MKEIFKSKKKKISMDISEDFLDVIDELAELTKNSRTTILEAVISRGIFPYFNLLKNLWKDHLKENKNERTKNQIKDLIKDLEEIKSKHEWLNPDYYWENLLSKKNLDEETKRRMVNLLRHMDLMPTDKKKFQKLLNKK